ncbi:MAG: D-2-hydroxyacid dehydrogenase [Holophagales bacterium]|nr:D-2-hydroxyacid dehydrogenase [Holophagales bacterium]
MESPNRMAVVHHRASDWEKAIKAAEPRLDVRAWHPRDALAADDGWLNGAKALFTWRFPQGFLQKMPNLVWVQNAGAGVDHLIQHPELSKDIAITRADGRFGLWIARYVCGHLLFEAQEIDSCRQAQAERRWAGKLLPERLHGKTALIVGFGRIGRQVGLSLRTLGMDVVGFATQDRPDPDFQILSISRLPEFIPSARALVLCAPATDATKGMINADVLAHGHSCLTLINVGRGSQIVLPDMVAALDEGRLGRAVLDVFPAEPLDSKDPMWAHPNITITPHHSGPTVIENILPDILPNLRAYAENRPIVGAVDRERGY